MSRTAKALFLGSVLFSGVSIWGVHMIQVRERETMYAGVIRDEARLLAKKQQKERELEFQEQARKRAYLEKVQQVSNPVTEPMRVGEEEVPKSAEGLDFGCKTCEKP
ncbi:Pet117p [Sporobolomyces salmoneus]|uniref:Pet117p n=1 Tax=Sporobolomyces salmoneus TaxID=183962 RepID=UPI003178D1C8